MAALDQAFIKAFSQQSTVPLASPPQPVAPRDQESSPRKNGTRRKTENGNGTKAKTQTAKTKTAAARVKATNGKANASSAVVDACDLIEPSVVVGQMPTTSSYTSFTSESTEAYAISPVLPTLNDILSALQQTIETVENADDLSWASQPSVAAAAKVQEPVISAKALEKTPLPEAAAVEKPTASIPAAAPTPEPIIATTRAWKPAWQVDHFSWPKICRRLTERARDEMDRLADSLQDCNRKGRKVLAMGGCHRGEGVTTLLLCVAKRLAERGVKLVMVDADLNRPRLAKRLGIETQSGWDDIDETQCHSLDEAIVEAADNHLSLLPAQESAADRFHAPDIWPRLSRCLTTLADHYDLILLDTGPLDHSVWVSHDAANLIGAMVLVHNRQNTSDDEQQEIEAELASAGMNIAGVVENFVTED